MLCDAACLARDDIGVADSVQKRGLSVVDVPEYADNRRARNVIFNVVLRPFYGLFFLGLLLFAPMPYIEIKSVLFCYYNCGWIFYRLVHRSENPHIHQLGYEPKRLQIHSLCKVADNDWGF